MALSFDKGCAPALLKRGVDTKRMKKLGQGFFGTAYMLNDGRVLKVTNDLSELELATWLLKHRGALPTLLPRIDSAYMAACGSSKGMAEAAEMLRRLGADAAAARQFGANYYIVREDLRDVARDTYRNAAEEKHLERLDKLLYALKLWMGRRTPTHEKEVVAALASSGYPAKWQKNVLDSLLWMKKNKVFVTDIKLANMGIRPSTGDLVIRDVGQASTPDVGEFEMLQGLRLKARRL